LAQIEAKAFNGQNIEMNVSLKGFSGAFNELMKR
jgi:invasion protein IalB